MQIVKMSFTTRLLCSARLIHTSCILDNNMSKLGRNMNKLMRGSNTVKRKWYDSNMGHKEVYPTITSLTNTSGQHGKVANRRTKILGKLFMRHITDQMSTGYIASKIYGRSIEISRVRVTNDFKIVNIYWLGRGVPEDVETHNLLNEVSGLLRHELSQLCLMGQVPKLLFVKERNQTKSMEVELTLAKADFGEEYVPTDASHALKSEYILKMKLDPRLKEEIKMIEDKEFFEELQIPPMSEATLGLDRGMIMRRLVATMTKMRNDYSDSIESNSDSQTYSNFSSSTNDLGSIDTVSPRTDFQEFLRNRKIAQRKAYRTLYDNMKVKETDENNIEDDEEFLSHLDDAEEFEAELDMKYDFVNEKDEHV